MLSILCRGSRGALERIYTVLLGAPGGGGTALTALLQDVAEARSGGPGAGEDFGLLDDSECGLLLFVGWVAICAEEALDEDAAVSAGSLSRTVQSTVRFARMRRALSRALSRALAEETKGAVVTTFP